MKTNFITDIEKLLDMKEMEKEDFLNSYSYLTEEEYDNTLKKINFMGGFESYSFSKHCFDIMNRNSLVFRFAISDLMSKGIDGYEKISYDEIRSESRENGLMTKEFVIDLLTTAKHLSRLSHIHLLNYISKNVEYDVGDTEIGYDRYKIIAENACQYATDNAFEYGSCEDGLKILRDDIGLDDEEIEELGFGWAIQNTEE